MDRTHIVRGSAIRQHEHQTAGRIQSPKSTFAVHLLCGFGKALSSPVKSGIPQGLVLGVAPFNIFVGNMDKGMECTLSRFTINVKLSGVVNTLDGRDAIQRDIDRLEM